MPISIPVSAGELVDRITILRIKADRIPDAAKLANVRSELTLLEEVCEREVGLAVLDEDAARQLVEVNRNLWDLIDELHALEEAQEFGEPFIQASRRVYQLNDLRFRLKRDINQVYGAEVIEEKSYGGAEGSASA